MIAYLSGIILEKSPSALVLHTQGGVGYLVYVPARLAEQVAVNDQIALHIYTRVAETALDLFGFVSTDDLVLFKQLISVSGVGPKTAMSFFDLPTDKLCQAIIENNVAYVGQVKGIGKKTAEKICIDLSSKLDMPVGVVSGSMQTDEDSLEALVSLGYDRRSVEKLLADCPSEIASTEARIKWCLQNI